MSVAVQDQRCLVSTAHAVGLLVHWSNTLPTANIKPPALTEPGGCSCPMMVHDGAPTDTGMMMMELSQ
jgi:hypothetical protein